MDQCDAEDEVHRTAWILLSSRRVTVVGVQGEANLEGPKVAEAGGGDEGGGSWK